ncbi:MAG TPA: hypothetical protein VLD84_11030 [Nitrososphaeraceae archaeon]|nr:hypothetical protein [Nitrososphaeraceae archaeon]
MTLKCTDNFFKAILFSPLDISPSSMASFRNLIDLSKVLLSTGKGTPSFPPWAKLYRTGSFQEVRDP